MTPSFPLLCALGAVAGVLTTVSGLGGGMVLLLALSLLVGPTAALALTAPAQLVGNLHRAVLLRDRVDRAVAWRFALGGLPGSVAGGLLAVALPELALRVLLVTTTGLAVWRVAAKSQVKVPAPALVPAGFGVGAVSATSGGAGLLVAPLLMSSGLTGERYIATGAVAAMSLHCGRLIAYGGEGLVTRATLVAASALAAAILGGNVLGDRLRKRLDERASRIVEVGVLVLSVALAVAGLR